MKAVLLGTTLLLVAGGALACKCAHLSLAEQVSSADVVFVGSTQSSPSRPGREGETITFKVTRGIKAIQAGASIAIDPRFASDCAAQFQPGIQLLVFAYKASAGSFSTSACSVRAAESFPIGGHMVQPAPETLKFLNGGGT